MGNANQVNQNGLVYGTFSDMVTKRHLNGRKQTVSIRNFGHSITAPYTAPYFPSDTVTIRLFTYINGPYYCARKYGPYRSTWEDQFLLGSSLLQNEILFSSVCSAQAESQLFFIEFLDLIVLLIPLIFVLQMLLGIFKCLLSILIEKMYACSIFTHDSFIYFLDYVFLSPFFQYKNYCNNIYVLSTF